MTSEQLRRILAGLKDFQRETVDHVFNRLYGKDPVRRFLIADEVGLGKTLVARGLIAKAIRELRRGDPGRRIDIVYICSNADLARQNIRKLNLTGKDFELPTRITLLPTRIRELGQNDLNFISFTPRTSFDLRSSEGTVEERALLCKLLCRIWKSDPKLQPTRAERLLAGNASLERLRGALDALGPLWSQLKDAFRRGLRRERESSREARRPTLRQRFLKLTWSKSQNIPERRALVGELRTLLAECCLNSIRPTLIIMDEFQRFKHLLQDDPAQASRLAQSFFNYAHENPDARILLLSATPYRMYTLYDEARDDDHYADFLSTVSFLAGGGNSEFPTMLEGYRRAILAAQTNGVGPVEAMRQQVQSYLKRVMVRTEKLAATADRDGMLREVLTAPLAPKRRDIESWLALQKVARELYEREELKQKDTLEYWKSAPYCLNFMDNYQLKQAFHDNVSAPEMKECLSGAPGALLPWSRVRRYQKVDPGNARLRALAEDTKDLWRLLWLPPTLPYYDLGPPFDRQDRAKLSKRLVFSSWRVVPRAVSLLLSFEAERQMMRCAPKRQENTAAARQQHAQLLRFGTGEKFSGMYLLALLLPWRVLTEDFDPLGCEKLSRKLLLQRTTRRIQELLDALPASFSEGPRQGDTWYWAAPILLDRACDSGTETWLSCLWVESNRQDISEEDNPIAGLGAAIQEARRVLDTGRLGQPPRDLARVLAEIAVGGPATAAWRALQRVSGTGFDARALRTDAARIAFAVRSLFNHAETTVFLRGFFSPKKRYWRAVLTYCVNGCLQAVLDEYAHLLRDQTSPNAARREVAREIAVEMQEALTLRTPSFRVDRIKREARRLTLDPRRRMRARIAMPYGDQRAEEESAVTRAEQVRTAFNSPFWPFVLVTTSIGQEGLDFHRYCHMVVHWNLPANPVDLEQREGRVHRYKGHAVRKNLVAAYGVPPGPDDPWQTLFDLGTRERKPGLTDLEPFWIYPGEACIERHVPRLTMSREIERFSRLRASLTVYRMAFGQARQEDLMQYLLERLDPEARERLARAVSIDLRPG